MKLLRSASLLAVAAMSVSALTACSSGDGGDDEVVASFYPLAWAAQRVTGDHADVVNLTSPGAEPHDLELSIQQIARLGRARLVIHSAGLQPAVDSAIDENVSGTVVDASAVVELIPADEHDHDDGEASSASEHSVDDGHDHGDQDPHFWLDPLLMADVGDQIAAEMSALDPDHAADFEENATRLRSDLEALDREYVDGLASCERDVVVVTHDAFGYLGRYGLHFEPILGLTPEAEPTAATLAQLRTLIRTEGLTTVFSESLSSPRTAEALARDAGVRTDVLDPLEGLGPDTADEDYLSLMRANLAALQKANQC